MQSMKELAYTQRSTRGVLSILDPTNLKTPDDLTDALEELSLKITQPCTNIVEITKDICTAPNLFEPVLSGLGDHAADKIVRALKSSFPESNAVVYESSWTKQLLERLASYFSCLDSFPDDTTRVRCQQASERIPQLHRALTSLAGSMTSQNRSRKDGYEAVTIDKKPFEELEIECPKTTRDVQNAIEALLRALKIHFEYFLTLLKGNRWLGEIIREQYFRFSAGTIIDVAYDQSHEQAVPRSPSLHTFSGRKTALVLRAVEGFGEQRILLSSRAIRDLQNAQSHSPLYSSILRALGSLSRDNDTEVPAEILSMSGPVVVRAAKVRRGCAIVYCKDNVPSLNHEGTDEAIRVFGIFNALALKDSFWVAFANQIAARRAQRLYPSASVSHHESQLDPLETDEARAEQYADKMRSLLVISKFVDLSQNVLEAIQHGGEIFQAFELSPQEQKMLDYNGSCYVLGRSGTGKTTIMVMKMLATEMTHQQYPDMMPSKPRQLFVTRSQHLASKVKETFDEMYNSHLLGISHSPERRQHALVNVDGRRFGMLTDDEFPLFVSFDHLCSMIEAELQFACPTWKGHAHGKQISYDIFLYQYWPRLDSPLRGIEPSLVFGQFIGIIQGSEQSLLSTTGYISRDEYVNMRRPAAFSQIKDRHHVYDLFEKYKKLKSSSFQHDLADRTHAILRGLKNAPSSLRGAVDFLFVDEVQDNLLIDIRLLRFLCNTPDGLFWAGDTAQTVFSGSAFTFNELKSFMWRTEREITLAPEIAIREPTFFELTVNFRSQQGILACAQSVLDCISTLWPSTVDRLPREKGLSRGKRPLMFVQKDCERDLLQFLVRNARGSVELGAEQCIIVRDETARANARKATEVITRDTTQILTIYESKGLEYEDVILYNFFTDSLCDLLQWRHLLSQVTSLAEHPNSSNSYETAKFDAIARELKFLYVACTRAKHTLWIIDTSEKAEAIRRLWEKNDEIDWQEETPDISQFASASSKDLWQHKAREYLLRGYYDLARRAFRNAGLLLDADIASAYLLREFADVSFTTVSAVESGKRYRKAADAFDQVALKTDRETNLAYHHIAAECYVKVPDRKKAAVAFENALDYNQAIKLHRGLGDFERTIQLLCENIDAMRPDGLLEAQYATQIFCVLNIRIIDILKVFSGPTDALHFAIRHGLGKAEEALLKHQNRHSEVILQRLRTDRFVTAGKLIQLHSLTAVCFSDLASACSRHMSIASIDWSDNMLPTTKKMDHLLNLISICGYPGSACQWSSLEIDTFRAIAFHDEYALRRFTLTANANNYVALLCFSHIMPSPTKCKGKTGAEILEWLKTFLPMCHLLRDLCLRGNPENDLSVQLVLGFRCVTPDIFHLLPGSAIERRALARKTPFLKSSGDTSGLSFVSREVLRNLLVHCLADSLRRRVFEAISILHREFKRPKDGFVPLNLQLEYFLYMAMLVDDTRQLVVVEPQELQKEKSNILRNLYRAFISTKRNDTTQLSFSLASLLDIGQRDVRKGIHVIQAWVRDSIAPTASSSTNRMTDLMRAFILMFAFRAVSPQLFQIHQLQPDADERPPYSRVPIQNSSELHSMKEHLLNMINGRKEWSPRPLICLLSAVAVRKIAVNVDILCSTIEIVAGWISLLYSKSTLGSVEGTVLSQHCLITYGQALSDSSRERGEVHVNLARCLVTALTILLREVLCPREIRRLAFLYFGSELMNPYEADRHIYVARICEAMILLGHNVPASGLRTDILTAITSLQGLAKQYPKLYKGYIAATTWAELTTAIPDSLPLVMLQVVRSRRFLVTGTTHATYEAVPVDLPLVGRKAATLQVRKAGFTLVGKSRESGGIWRTFGQSSSGVPKDWIKDRALADVIDEVAQYQVKAMWHPLKLFAVTRIQTFYRRRLCNRRQVYYGGLAFLVSGAFTECLNEVQSIEWHSRRYRMVFLGVLPHALACLDAMIMQFAHLKPFAAKRLQEAEHLQYEKLGHEVAAIHDNMEAAKVLRSEKLGPKSKIYRLHLWEQFRTHIQEVEQLMSKLPPNSIQDLDKEWSVVRKAVLRRGRSGLDITWADAGFGVVG